MARSLLALCCNSPLPAVRLAAARHLGALAAARVPKFEEWGMALLRGQLVDGDPSARRPISRNLPDRSDRGAPLRSRRAPDLAFISPCSRAHLALSSPSSRADLARSRPPPCLGQVREAAHVEVLEASERAECFHTLIAWQITPEQLLSEYAERLP